ncbi:MAG: hypothetical protein ACOH2L_17865 [Devosia sp.]
MRKSLLSTLLLLAITGPVLAQTVTITTSLGDHGFAQGFLLSGRQASSFYLPLPAGTDISNLHVAMKGLAVAPNIQRGSVVISVNGQPVDALRLGKSQGAEALHLDAVVDGGGAFRAPALDLRFRADMLASDEICADNFDPADIIQILPDTTISFDVDLAAVTTLSDALALLPWQPVLEMPLPLTPETSAAALQLSSALARRGYRASMAEQAGPDAVASLRLVPASANGAITLEHDNNKLAILVPENADIAAFDRLWQFAPAALGSAAIKSDVPLVEATAPAPRFWRFPILPGPMRVVQTGELGLDFPMLNVNGRSASQIRLRLTVAPDWSNARPVVTLYLNGQLFSASRAEIGENMLTATLPADLLLLSNRLSVTVDRAQVEGYCSGLNPGHAVELLPGSGVVYDGVAEGGFALVGDALRRGGTVILPEAARGENGLPYLNLASRVLTGLGAGPAPLMVAFGDTVVAAGPVLSIAPASAEGLVMPIGHPNLTLESDQPLATLTADAEEQRLDISVSDAQDLPDPTGIFLGNSDAAVLGSEGVIWQNAPTVTDSSAVQRARDASEGIVDVVRNGGLIWVLLSFVIVSLVVLARALIKGNARRKASK